MPSVSTAKVNVNFEPTIGTISLSPTTGYSLDTIFTIKLLNFEDDDFPLSYKFYFYFTEGLYDLERELGVNPINSKRDFLHDNLFKNEFSTRLNLG